MGTETVFNPIPTDAKVTFITTTFMIDHMAIATLDHPTSQGDQPHKHNAETQEQAVNASSIFQMGRFQVKTISLQIAIHFFDPHPFTIDFQQGGLARLVGNQIPRLVFTPIPMQKQPIPTGVMFLGQAHPADNPGLTLFEGQGFDFDPGLSGPTDLLNWRMLRWGLSLLIQDMERAELIEMAKEYGYVCWDGRWMLYGQFVEVAMVVGQILKLLESACYKVLVDIRSEFLT